MRRSETFGHHRRPDDSLGRPGNALVTRLTCWFAFRGCLVMTRDAVPCKLLSTLLSTLPLMPALAADCGHSCEWSLSPSMESRPISALGDNDGEV